MVDPRLRLGKRDYHRGDLRRHFVARRNDPASTPSSPLRHLSCPDLNV
jgi:hypothetical protein